MLPSKNQMVKLEFLVPNIGEGLA